MAQTITEGLVPVAGNIISFDKDATIVYGVNGAIPANAIDHGFANEDGVTEAGDRSNTNIMTWQNSQNFRTITTEASKTFQFTLLQVNDDNLELAVGRGRNAETGGFHVDAGISYPHRGWFIDAIDTGENKKIRLYLPDAQVTSVGERTINAQGVYSQDITLTAYATTVEGELCNYILWDGPATTSGS